MDLRFYENDGWEAWLEPEIGDVAVGLCVGSGLTRSEASADARRNLLEILKELKPSRALIKSLSES